MCELSASCASLRIRAVDRFDGNAMARRADFIPEADNAKGLVAWRVFVRCRYKGEKPWDIRAVSAFRINALFFMREFLRRIQKDRNSASVLDFFSDSVGISANGLKRDLIEKFRNLFIRKRVITHAG